MTGDATLPTLDALGSQAIRLRRNMYANVGAVLFTLVSLAFWHVGTLRLQGHELALALCTFWCVNLGFSFALHSGMNLRFRDPSMTFAQMLWSAASIITLVYFLNEMRAVALVFYLGTMMFGCFKLNVRQFVTFACIAALSYALCIGALYIAHPEHVNVGEELLTWSVFVTVLLFIALLGSDLSRLRAELTKQNYELNGAVASAERARCEKAEFLASMSHEIKTPLNSILGLSAELETGRLDGPSKRQVATIRRCGEHLLTLVDGLLDTTLSDNASLTLAHNSFDLTGELEQLRYLLETSADAKGLRIQFAVTPQVPRYVTGDAARLRQLLFQLVSDTMRLAPGGGDITLQASSSTTAANSEDKHALTFVVHSAGNYATANERDFMHSEHNDVAALTSTSSSAMGFVLARKLAQLMDGDVALASSATEGFTFTVSIKLAKGTATPGLSLMATDTAQREFPRRVLVVDDSIDNRDLLRTYLSATGCAVVEAQDATTAMRRFRQEPFDLVLMDIHMPDIDGLTATQELRKIERREQRVHTPIIAITADTIAQSKERSKRAGCDAHLTKPLRKAALLAAVEQTFS